MVHFRCRLVPSVLCLPCPAAGPGRQGRNENQGGRRCTQSVEEHRSEHSFRQPRDRDWDHAAQGTSVAARTVASTRPAGTAARVNLLILFACSRQPDRLEPLQPVPQPLTGSGQAALDCSHRTAQQPGRLFAGPALQVAEHDRRPEPLGQPADFRMQERSQVFATLRLVARLRRLQLTPLPLVPPPPGRPDRAHAETRRATP